VRADAPTPIRRRILLKEELSEAVDSTDLLTGEANEEFVYFWETVWLATNCFRFRPMSRYDPLGV